MEKKQKGRWGYLFSAAIFGYLLYDGIREYEYLSTLDIFSPEQWAVRAQNHWFMMALYGICFAVQLFQFVIFGMDQDGIWLRFSNAALYTLAAVIEGCVLLVVGVSGTLRLLLWIGLLVILAWAAISEWRGFWKVCRKREME